MSTNPSAIPELISIVETVAPNVATMLGGPLSGAITSGIVTALHVGGVGLDLPAAAGPADLVSVLSATPHDVLHNLLAELENEVIAYLGQQASNLSGAYVQLPYPDKGVEVNAYDNGLKLLSLVASAAITVISVVSPNTANLLTQWGPTVCGAIGMGVSAWLSNQTAVRSNANTRALAAIATKPTV
jgi:hypothetical protein